MEARYIDELWFHAPPSFRITRHYYSIHGLICGEAVPRVVPVAISDCPFKAKSFDSSIDTPSSLSLY